MKYRNVLISVVITLGIQTGIIFLMLDTVSKGGGDTVEANSLTYEIIDHWEAITTNNYLLTSSLDFTILSSDEEILFSSNREVANTINRAIAHRDTIIDLKSQDTLLGKVIINNPILEQEKEIKNNILAVTSISFIVEIMVFVLYTRYIHQHIFKPFETLKKFSVRVAGGDLDFPLEMDSKNIFGAFSESFDLMREELKKARIQEQAANQSKKELVAKLSHDIKTPIASIKAISELMEVKETSATNKQQLLTIMHKADQIDTLISDLFNATLEEMQELNVTSKELPSTLLQDIIREADYRNLANIDTIPSCILQFDPLRLQQVFDNIFSNSYKYANTPITVSFYFEDPFLNVVITDYGTGVKEEELPLLFEKFYQGENTNEQSGVGLGLFISKYLLSQMGGMIECYNKKNGFSINISLSLGDSLKN